MIAALLLAAFSPVPILVSWKLFSYCDSYRPTIDDYFFVAFWVSLGVFCPTQLGTSAYLLIRSRTVRRSVLLRAGLFGFSGAVRLGRHDG